MWILLSQSLLKCHEFAKYTLAYITILGDFEKGIVRKTPSTSYIEAATQ